jgi:hypothetical protein
MAATKKDTSLGPIAIALYALVTLVGLFAAIAFIKTGSPFWGIPFMFSLPAAGRLHANYFRRIR